MKALIIVLSLAMLACSRSATDSDARALAQRDTLDLAGVITLTTALQTNFWAVLTDICVSPLFGA